MLGAGEISQSETLRLSGRKDFPVVGAIRYYHLSGGIA
jgi:hypothetical protein